MVSHCLISKPLNFGVLEKRKEGSVLREDNLVNPNPCEIPLWSLCAMEIGKTLYYGEITCIG